MNILHRMLPVAWKQDQLKSESFDANKESGKKASKSTKLSKKGEKSDIKKSHSDYKRKFNNPK